MSFRILTRAFDKVARAAGYVPASEMKAALAEKDKLQGELRHKNANLRSTIYLRNRLEREVQFLRELELAHAKKESGTQQAVDRLDTITGNLLEYMKSVWPEAVSLDEPDPTGATEETKESAAV